MSLPVFAALMVVALIFVPIGAQRIYKMRPSGLRAATIGLTVAAAAAGIGLAVWYYQKNLGLVTNYAFVALFFFWLLSIMACTPDEA